MRRHDAGRLLADARKHLQLATSCVRAAQHSVEEMHLILYGIGTPQNDNASTAGGRFA